MSQCTICNKPSDILNITGYECEGHHEIQDKINAKMMENGFSTTYTKAQ